MKTNKLEVEGLEAIAIGQRIQCMQKRKAKVNAELSTLRRRIDTLQQEAEELAKEHLQLLRKFDSVAQLP